LQHSSIWDLSISSWYFKLVINPGSVAYSLIAGILTVDAHQSQQFERLFLQLQRPETTDEAFQMLLRDGKSDREATKYLSLHLPQVIESGPPKQMGLGVTQCGWLEN
jgi:hypothetical protein